MIWYCSNCDGEIEYGTRHCPNCGAKINWPWPLWLKIVFILSIIFAIIDLCYNDLVLDFWGLKEWVLIIIPILIVLIGSEGFLDHPTVEKILIIIYFLFTLSAIVYTLPDVFHDRTKMERVSVGKMVSDLEKNAVKAQKKYDGKWFEIVGELGDMDSDGDYFSLDEEGFFSSGSVDCDIPFIGKTKLTKILAGMKKGDRIAVKGKVVDMGESMGYDVTVEEITPKPKKGDGIFDDLKKDLKEIKKEFKKEMKKAINDLENSTDTLGDYRQ